MNTKCNILAFLCTQGEPVVRHQVLRKGPFYRTTGCLTRLGIIAVIPPDAQHRYRRVAITQRGVMLYLRICAAISKGKLRTQVDFSNMARSHTDALPKIFNLWARFQDRRVAYIFENVLIGMASRECGELPRNFLKKFERQAVAGNKDPYAIVIQDAFFDIQNVEYLMLRAEDRKKLFKALADDADLAKPFIECIDSTNITDELRIGQRLYSMMLRNLKGLDRIREEGQKALEFLRNHRAEILQKTGRN